MFAFHIEGLQENEAQERRDQFLELATGGAIIEEHVPPRDAAEADSRAVDALRFELVLYALDEADAELLARSLTDADLEFRREEFEDVDWGQAWKAHHPAIELGQRLFVSPPWDDSMPPADRVRIVIEPGMAFGLGDAPSTRLSYELMEPQVTPGCLFADLGTGSGILAIAARLLGAGHIEAVDIEEGAVEATRANAHRNGIVCDSDDEPFRFNVKQGSIDVMEGPFDLIVANIVFETLAPLLSMVVMRLNPGAHLVLGGIRPRHINDLALRLRALGLEERARRVDDDMAALAFS